MIETTQLSRLSGCAELLDDARSSGPRIWIEPETNLKNGTAHLNNSLLSGARARPR